MLQSQYRRVLGRGLSSLIPNKANLSLPDVKHSDSTVLDFFRNQSGTDAKKVNKDLSDQTAQIVYIDPNEIVANPYQPRTQFEENKLLELAASIKEHGILNPLIVTLRQDRRYELISGERRLRAAKSVGLDKVPVIVRDADELKKLELALIENIQREDLNLLELAQAYKMLIDEFGLKQEELGKAMGVSRPQITNTIRLLDLPEEVKISLISGEITEGHARAILSVDNIESRLSLLRKITLHKMNVRVAEAEARQIKVKKHTRNIKVQDALIVEMEDSLSDKLATKVSIQGSLVRGKVVVDYFSQEELERIVSILQTYKYE